MSEKACVALVSIAFDPTFNCSFSGVVEDDIGLEIVRLENLGVETAAIAQ
jgi:hypothetical protein